MHKNKSAVAQDHHEISLQTAAIAVAGFLPLAATSAEVDCPYEDNSEWPQPEGKVCQQPAIPALLLADDGSAAGGGLPYCERSDSDSDGDGYGWENNRSCLVRAVDTTPVCVSASSDTDGDGWGWENNASCLVGARNPNAFPSCQFRDSDPDGDGWGFENGVSCQITITSSFPRCSNNSTDPDGDGWGYENGKSCKVADIKQAPVVVFQQSFDSLQRGSFSASLLNDAWDTPIWHLGFVQGRVDIVAEANRGNAMRVKYPANRYGAAGATAFLSDVKFGVEFPQSYEELYVAYDVKFGGGFDFVRGGKLPGLCGYDNTKLPHTGCNTGGGFPDGFDGFSARGMWRENGELENYVYHADQTNFFGDDELWGERARPGIWHRVQHRVVMNTPGQANGILEAWLDGKKVLSGNDYLYRKTANIGINLFYFSTFFGGNDSSWAPSQDQFIYFDNFRIATQPE